MHVQASNTILLQMIQIFHRLGQFLNLRCILHATNFGIFAMRFFNCWLFIELDYEGLSTEISLEVVETFRARLSLSVPPQLQHLTAVEQGITTVTIVDDDFVSVSLMFLQYSVSEEGGNVSVCVELEGSFDDRVELEVMLETLPMSAKGTVAFLGFCIC